jgi:hypothetical protein
MLALGGAHKHKPHQRRLTEIEAADALTVHERLKPLAALSLRKGAPIGPFDRNLDSLDHLLHGLRYPFPAEATAQNRMSRDEPVPSSKEVRFVQWFV